MYIETGDLKFPIGTSYSVVPYALFECDTTMIEIVL